MCWENNSTVYNVYEYNSKHIYSFCPIDYKSCFKLLNNKTLERKSRENWQGGWPLIGEGEKPYMRNKQPDFLN